SGCAIPSPSPIFGVCCLQGLGNIVELSDSNVGSCMAHITRFFYLGGIGGDARFTRRMLALSALSFLFLITAGAAAIYMANRSAAGEDAIIHGTEVRRSARSLHVELLNAELGQRGFLLTTDEKYLEPYVTA